MSPQFQPFADAWEGVSAADFTLDRVRQRVAGLAPLLLERGLTCLVAADTRFMSGMVAHAIYQSMLAAGVQARLAAGPAPLPAVQHALDRQQAGCALVVSARNRPYWYNGLVLLAPPGLRFIVTAPPAEPTIFPSDTPPPGGDQLIDLRASYLDDLRAQADIELIRRVSLTIFIDPMNGTTAGYFPSLIVENGQTRAIEINKELDPLFARVTPLPAESGLTRMRKLVRESDSHLGLAFSADGTALGVVDKNGEQLELLEMALLLGLYLARQHRQRGVIVAPPPNPTSLLAQPAQRLAAWEEALGVKVELHADPGSRMQELLAAERPGLLLGCTPEGELVLGRYGPCPDGLLGGLLFAEMVARNNGNLRDLIDRLREQLAKV
jgi:phosphomannomutase